MMTETDSEPASSTGMAAAGGGGDKHSIRYSSQPKVQVNAVTNASEDDDAGPLPPSPPAAASTQATVNIHNSSGLTKSSAVGAGSCSGNGNGGWDYPPPVASPVGRLLLSSNNCNKIWYPLPVEWRTPQRLFTLHPSSSSSSSTVTSMSTEPTAPSSSATTIIDPREDGGGSGDSAASATSNTAATAAATTANVPTTASSSTTMSSSGSMAGTIAGSDLSGDNSSNTTSKKNKNTTNGTSSASNEPPVRSTLCAPIIILRNKYVLVAVNEDTLVLYGNLDTHHHQKQDELRSDSDANYEPPPSNVADTTNEDGNIPEEKGCGENNDNEYLPLPQFSTPPLVQCSLASLVVEEAEGKKQRNDDTTTTTTTAAATMDIVEWNIVQMVWIEESNTLYVLMDDSYILKLYIRPPALLTSTSSTSKLTPSIELEQYWMSENLGVTCMAVQRSSQSTTESTAGVGDDGTDTEQNLPFDILYLGFETGMVEGWRVHHHQFHRRHIHSSANSIKRNNNTTTTTTTTTSSSSVSQSSSPKANNNKGSPTLSRRPSYSSGANATSNKNKMFVGPSASSLMLSGRRPSFNNNAEDEKYQETASLSPPVLMWTGSFPTPTTISSLAVLPNMKAGPISDNVESACDEEPVCTDADAPSVESRLTKERSIEASDDGITNSTKKFLEDKNISRENSFASIHSASGSTTAGPQPSSSPRNSPYTRRSIILPPSPLPRPPSFVSPSMSKDMDVNHLSQSLPAAFLVVVTIQRRLRPSSGNEDESDQPTSSMVQFLDLKRIFSDSMNGTSAPAIPSPRRSTGETTSDAPAADIGAKTIVSLLDYALNHGPKMDLIDSSTSIFDNQDGRLPKPSRTMAVRGADLTTMILPSPLSTVDDTKVDLNKGEGTDHTEGQQRQKEEERVKVGVMLPDGTAAILSSSSVSNGNDDHSFVGLHDEYHQFLLPFPAIGTGTVTIQDRNISSDNSDLDQQPFLACCVRGGTCYLLPTSSIHNDQRTSPSSIKRRIRRPIQAFAFPHDVDTDLASVYVQSFTAGNLVVDSNESEVPVMLFSSPGGTVDVYSCELLPVLPTYSSTRSSLASEKNRASKSIIRGDQSGKDSNDFKFLPREERMVLEDMIEDGTIAVFLNVIREIKSGNLDDIRTVLKDEDGTNCWDDVVDIFGSIDKDDGILSHLEGNSVDLLSTLCCMPRMQPVRELLLSLALE